MSIYNLPNNTSGVYVITNIVTGEQYVGSSVNIRMRISTHFSKGKVLKMQSNRFYREIISYGISNFKWEVIEVCDKENLLEREQYWYDVINPTYNQYRPVENMFKLDGVQRKATKIANDESHVKARTELYNTPEYKELFRNCHTDRMKACCQYDLDCNFIQEFKSLREAARWLDENTEFKAKNKTSKVKSVCDGERKTAFGYKWEYSETSND